MCCVVLSCGFAIARLLLCCAVLVVVCVCFSVLVLCYCDDAVFDALFYICLCVCCACLFCVMRSFVFDRARVLLFFFVLVG